MDNIAPPLCRRDRRIALLKPRTANDVRAAHAMQLLSSMLWAFRGTTRSAWETVPPDEADVIVFHAGDDRDGRVANWQASGKLAVEITTNSAPARVARHALIYPFRAVQAFALLEQLDAELRSSEVPEESPAGSTLPNGVIPQADQGSFVTTLRELRSGRGHHGWSKVSSAAGPILWVNSGGVAYFAESATVHSIRDGTLRLAGLQTQPSRGPPEGAVLRAEAELSWFCAYHSSKRLVADLNESARYRLIRWPNLGAIRPPTSQLRSLAVLAGEFTNVATLAARAQIPREEAIRTLNALTLHGLLAPCGPESTSVVTLPPVIPQSFGGLGILLQRVRKHLGLGA